MFSNKSFYKSFTLLILLISIASCTEIEANSTLNSNASTIVMSNDSMVILADTLNFNEVEYVKQLVYYDTLDYEVVMLMNIDTVHYNKSELYSYDSIYDLNNDKKVDLSVVYQSTSGFITYVYLFNAEKNALNTTALEFNNYIPIDNNSFFIVNKNNFVWEFKKHQWKEMETDYIKSIYVDLSQPKRQYFKIEEQDTLKINKNEILNKEMKAINAFIFGVF